MSFRWRPGPISLKYLLLCDTKMLYVKIKWCHCYDDETVWGLTAVWQRSSCVLC